MKVSNLKNTALCVLCSMTLLASTQANSPAFCQVNASAWSFLCQNTPVSDEECPAVTGIEVEFTQDGTALLTWDPILNNPVFTITVEDENGNLVFNTTITGNEIEVPGMEYGVEYTFTICYVCPYTGAPVCGSKKTRSVIIEDLIVMLNGNNCSCSKPHPMANLCVESTGYFEYALSPSKVYKVVFAGNEQISFVYTGGHVRRVGSCTSDYKLHTTGMHGSASFVEYLELLSNARIYFHNNHFCIENGLPTSVSACPISGGITTIYPPAFINLEAPVQCLVFPNPFSDVLNIKVPGTEGELTTGTLILYNAMGIPVFTQLLSDLPASESSVQVNTGGVAPGVYWLVIVRDGEPPLVIRVVKMG